MISMKMNPIASAAARRKLGAPSPEVVAQLDELVQLARGAGFHVEALPLARALVDKKALARLKKLLFNPAALAGLRARAQRIEFIAEGPLPPELLREPVTKTETIYTQIVDYALCKGCLLCIQVCPKRVYKDDGFGKPDALRHEHECTGAAQCGQCVYICPERAITMAIVNPLHESTLFVQLDNPYARAAADAGAAQDFVVPNPLAVGEALVLEALDADDLAAANRQLDAAGFFPVLELGGAARHLVDSADAAADLAAWARENGRAPARALAALRAVYGALPRLAGLKQGKYRLDTLIHRVIDEVLNADIAADTAGGRTLIAGILAESFVAETTLGSKRRPIGGLLPPATSVAWKTPYGNEVPVYTKLDKCLGPECGLCISHCPEGNGGEVAAIRMIPRVPLGVMPAMVRGLRAHLLKLDGSHARIEDAEDLAGRQPFEFEVNADYCKACGLCIACCPHDVIEPAARSFDMGVNA